jgi:RNA polymerase sigma factor (sigma-70 family)
MRGPRLSQLRPPELHTGWMVGDEQLLAAVATGDDDAFAVFYRRHLDPLLAFLGRRLPAAEQAFDLAAEVFAIVALSPSEFRGDGSASAWLYGIARNVLRSSLRRRQVDDAARRRLGVEPVPLTDVDLAAVQQRAVAGAGTLTALLEALPEPTRRALLARVAEEREHPQITAELTCSPHARARATAGTATIAVDRLEGQLRAGVRRRHRRVSRPAPDGPSGETASAAARCSTAAAG